MANSNTPTTLGNLEFSDIKKSLTDYLRNQSIFSGYNFEGSAIQTIIDLLAYNTFYYAYYANMINAEAFLDSAQKEDSVISLCKPLGFTVPSRTAAKAIVSVGGLSLESIPASTSFFAFTDSGTQYTFFTLEDIPVLNGIASQFEIYEGSRYVEFDAIPTFDYETQKIFIADTNFDLSTLKITIHERIDGSDEPLIEEWSLVDNIGYTAKIGENIYFVERTSVGFAILFGITNSLGRSIDTNIEKIIVRYLNTSGSDANGISNFTSSSGGIVQTVSASLGGREKPDLDYVRFVAPKWFAAQERAVTVNDYKALLLQTGYFQSEKQFNVFGGQDLTPPRYGRVFVTSIYTPSDEVVGDMIQFLKERSVITVFPEYISSNSLEVYVTFSFVLGPNPTKSKERILSIVKALFNANYATIGEFNASFSASDFIELIRANSDPDISNIIINPDDFTIYVKKVISSGIDFNIKLQNQLYLPISTSISITEPFESDLVAAGTQAVLKMFVQSNSAKNVSQPLQLWQRSSDGNEVLIPGVSVGSFIANIGSISINSGVISNTAELNVDFLKKSFSMSLEQLVEIKLDDNVKIR